MLSLIQRFLTYAVWFSEMIESNASLSFFAKPLEITFVLAFCKGLGLDFFYIPFVSLFLL